MAQTIEAYVGNALDEAKISPLHRRVVALIAAGYFFDVIDFTIFGSLVPYVLSSKFASGAEVALVGSATIFGMFIGTAGQGQFSDRFGRRFIYQFNLLVFGVFTILGAFAPTVTMLVICRFIAGLGLGAEQPLAFAYAGEYSPKRIRGRILAIVHFIGGACVWPIGTALVLLLGTTIFPTSPDTVWRCAWIIIGAGALIVWVFRFTLPESPRYLATHGRGQEALDVLKRLEIQSVPALSSLSTDTASNSKSDPFAVVFRMFPTRVIAGMICFTAFFGVAIGLGAWLPNMMNEKGFTITKSLQYTLAMNFAVPFASLFMMYALDKWGRKITSVCAFIGAAIMAIVFASAGAPLELMVAGFVMVFFIQVAGNAMQIFTSEVFPTNARASGFGWAAGVGRLATAFIMPSILLIQQTYGLMTVFVCLAILLLIAAASVTQLGPEAKQKGLDEIAPPTRPLIEADNAFWLTLGGAVCILLSVSWWLYFYLAAKQISSTLVCLLYTNDICQQLVNTATAAGKTGYYPFLTWIGIVLILAGGFMTMRKPASATKKPA
ncbi:MAG TPA: MFS transporter [Pseudolabrys sp.]|nr:MFS transporter [Pseudolabrys sp.]